MFSKYLPFYKRLITVAAPVVLTQAGQMVVQLVDNAMVGRVGTTELAAASFANSVYIIIIVLGIGLASGVTPLLGQAFGAKEFGKISKFIKATHLLSVGAIIVLVGLGYLISFLLPYMGQDEEVVKQAIPYYRLLVFSGIPFLAFMFLKQIGEGLGNTFLAMIATITSNLINIFLNYILIFGHWGFPELGLNGAGIATLIARIVMPIILYLGFFKVVSYRKHFLHSYIEKNTLKELKHLLSVGIPIALQMIVEVSLFALGAVMIGWLGEVPLAAHQIAMGVASFTFMIANGVAMATTIRVSIQLGDKNTQGVKMASYASFHLTFIYTLFTATAFIAFRNKIPYLFTTDPLVVMYAAKLLVIAGLFQISDGIQVIALGILRGISDVKAPMLIATASFLFLGLPLSYILTFTFKLGASGVWYGFVISLSIVAILLSYRIKKKWKTLPPSKV